MADDIVLDPGAGGATLATDEIGGIHHQRVKAEYGLDGVATDVSHTNPFPVIQGLLSPITSLATTASLAASSSTDLDSAQITVGTTGELVALIMTASVPFKAVLKTLLNGAESSDLAVFFALPGNMVPIILPSKKFFTQAHDGGAGLDGFRVTITNLDGTEASDVYCTFLYDEV